MAGSGGPPATLDGVQPGSDPALSPAPEAALPWTLRAAAGLVSAEALVEAVYVSGRDALTGGLRAALVLCVALKWVTAWRVLRRKPGAALALLLLEGTTVLAALGAVDASAPVRVALAAVALTVMGLLLASLHAFPSAPLPTVHPAEVR